MKKQYTKNFLFDITISYFTLFILAIVIWQIYYPGLMSPDSIDQYEQAYTGVFTDGHPPFMSIILWGWLKLGGSLGSLILIQCVLSVFGLKTLITLLIKFFNQDLIVKNIHLISTVITLLFLVPFLTPFMFFSVVFWKDAWLAIMLTWIISYLIWLFLTFKLIEKERVILHILLISLLSLAIVLVRHNAIVVLPAICLIIATIGKIKYGKKGVLVAIFPLLLSVSLPSVINYVFDIKPMYFGNTILASDLRTMLKLYPSLNSEYPLTSRHQNAPIFLTVGGTWDESTEGKPCPVIDCNKTMFQECFGTPTNTHNIDGSNCYMVFGNDNKVLKSEYVKAITKNPVKLLSTKLYLFGELINPKYRFNAKVPYDIYPNSYGLKINDNFENIRNKINTLSWDLGNKWYFIWISGLHPVWMFLNILSLIFFSFKTLKTRKLSYIISVFIYLIPLSYYLSYILASTTPDYRFMYPSTLVMQVLAISLLSSVILEYFHKTRENMLSDENH